MKTREQKRQEAEERNAAYRALTLDQKRDKISRQPGNSTKQLKKLARTE